MSIDFMGPCPLLQVFDMPTAIHFYRDVLGLKVDAMSQPDRGDDVGWVMLKGKGVELMLNTAYDEGERPAAPDPARVATHGDTGLFFGCKDLDAAYQHLRGHGVDLKEPKVAPYGMRQLSFKDPDGYGICFQWPANQKWQEEWEKSYGIEANTIG